MKLLLVLLQIVFAHAAVSTVAFADETDDLLIQKLSRVQGSLAPRDESKVPVTLRLADLLAERARKAYTADLEAGCTTCTAGIADRKKALVLYREVVGRASPEVQSRVHVQMGHLMEISGDSAGARKSYETSLAAAKSDEARAEAHLSIGEIDFRQSKYRAAIEHFAAVQATPASPSRGHAAYRRAWCLFHLNDLEGSISLLETILRTETLLTRSGSGISQVNVQFQEEVSRDYVTFLSRRPLKAGEIEKVEKLASERTKLQLIQTLGFETERLGHKQSAFQVWSYVSDRLSDPLLRFRANAYLSSLALDLGNEAEGTARYEQALNLRKGLKECVVEACVEGQKRLRSLLIARTQREKARPTPALLAMYKDYMEVMTSDVEAAQWGSQIARSLKQNADAQAFLNVALNSYKATGDAAKIENALLQKVEIAEDIGTTQEKSAIYEEYLRESKTRTKANEILYQRAQIFYEQKDYQTAATQFHALATNPKVAKDIRKKSADLALDTVVLLKNDDLLAAWSKEFAAQFPADRAEFEKIEQKTILTASANAAASDAAKSWALMAGFNPAKAGSEDRISFLKNKILLAEKLSKFQEGKVACDELLREGKISAEDRQFALARKAYFAETSFELKTAFETLKLVQPSAETREGRNLKLVLLAKAVGESPAPYLEEVMKDGKDPLVQAAVAGEIVLMSKDPVAELKRKDSVLRKSPPTYASLVRDIYGKNGNKQLLKLALEDEKLKTQEELSDLRQLDELAKFNAQFAKLKTAKIETKTQKLLAGSMKARIAQLNELDAAANKAITGKNWLMQVLTLDRVARESKRFYEEILSLPMPAGLSEEEQGQFMSMLSQQAAPYSSKAEQADSKVKEFWAGTEWKAGYSKAAGERSFNTIVKPQVQALMDIAPDAEKAFLASLTQANPAQDTGKVVAGTEERIQVLRAVQESPLDQTRIRALLDLEKKSGQQGMVDYLEARLQTMNGKATGG